MHGERLRAMRVTATVTWCLSFLFSITTIELLNDHFGRISPARQIVRYGELPFRDYFDPGYFLIEFSSAAMQRLLGDNLLGEVLLNAVFIATGTTLVLLLARRLSRSTVIGSAAAVLALLAMPRAYDYDKVLFYPLGLLLAWRYVERPRLPRLVALAGGIVIAGLYRYDSAVYLGVAAVIAVLMTGTDRWWTRARAVALLAILCAALVMPAVVFIGTHGGIADAVDQMITYGVRETEPLRLFVRAPLPPRDDRIQVRWAAAVTDQARHASAARFGLVDELPHGDPGSRTWSYRVTDEGRLRALVTDPAVDDTNGVDRQRFALMPEPRSVSVARAVPLLRLRFRPDLADSPWALRLFLGLWLLPVIGMIAAVRRASGVRDRVEAARVWSLIALCVLLDLFILRPPVAARVGGMAGPAAILAAWLVGRTRSLPSRVVAAAAVAATMLALSVVAEWPVHAHQARDVARDPAGTLSALAEEGSPRLASGPVADMAAYLRACTAPADRVYATWFAPDLYFFARRPFAGRVVATFSGHWSEPRFQQRTVAALDVQRPPIVLVDLPSYDAFRAWYPDVDALLRTQYESVGDRTFDDGGDVRYRVLMRRDRHPASTDARWGLPCLTAAGPVG
jgi:hypothetical protein